MPNPILLCLSSLAICTLFTLTSFSVTLSLDHHFSTFEYVVTVKDGLATKVVEVLFLPYCFSLASYTSFCSSSFPHFSNMFPLLVYWSDIYLVLTFFCVWRTLDENSMVIEYLSVISFVFNYIQKRSYHVYYQWTSSTQTLIWMLSWILSSYDSVFVSAIF